MATTPLFVFKVDGSILTSVLHVNTGVNPFATMSRPAPIRADEPKSKKLHFYHYMLSGFTPFIFFLSLNAAGSRLTDYTSHWLLIATVTLLFLSVGLCISLFASRVIRSNINSALFGGLVLTLMLIYLRSSRTTEEKIPMSMAIEQLLAIDGQNVVVEQAGGGNAEIVPAPVARQGVVGGGNAEEMLN
ncbi:hypothetical protein ACFE04_030919 [Oxalis oulophora]